MALCEPEIDEAEKDIAKIRGIEITNRDNLHLCFKFERQRAKWERNSKTKCFGTFIPPDDERIITIRKRSPKLERETLRKLTNLRRNGIFKKADKGASLVYMTKDYYNRAAAKQLAKDNYTKLEEDNTEKIISEGFDEIKIEWDKDESSFGKKLNKLKVKGKRDKVLYQLPKVHKPVDIDGLLKFRPIVDCKFTTGAEIDKFCAEFLAPLTDYISKIAVKDNIKALEKLRSIHNVNDETTLIGIDVEDLYTNVPIAESIGRTIDLAKESGLGNEKQRETVRKLLLLILKCNVFKFGNEIYQIREGLPMGSSSAPLLADAFLFSLERHKIARFENNGNTVLRYRDDILGVCTNENEALKLKEIYESLHPNLKITYEISKRSTNFLDIRVSNLNGSNYLRLGVYHKATDTMEMLDWKSEHTRETLEGVVYGKCLRIIRTVNNKQDFWSEMFNLFSACKKKHYLWSKVMKIATKALSTAMKTSWPYRRKKNDDDEFKTNTVILYAKHLEPIYKILKKRKKRVAKRVGRRLITYLQKTADV